MATARTLDQIIAELNPTYQPQIQSIQSQQALIPGQIQTAETALGAKQQSAFGDILSGARRRGTGIAFGGIPLSEQAKYTATEYMPALANLRTAGTQQATSMQDAINAINERRDTAAQNIYQTEQDRLFTEQENARNRAATSASAFNPTNFADYFTKATEASKPYYEYDATKGYNFKDAVGTPITAIQFANMTGTPVQQLLKDMAAKGDRNAKIALNIVNSNGEFTNAPAEMKPLLEAIGATGTYTQPFVSGSTQSVGRNIATSALKRTPAESYMAKLFGLPQMGR